ncbi:hypothetical protein HZ326_22490 [Fusarium oxysporum f. sp. albedinis]|nr:hypothetical protein HZ326_22490 [Fusarium oxysporum f. sp. albedinis]
MIWESQLYVACHHEHRINILLCLSRHLPLRAVFIPHKEWLNQHRRIASSCLSLTLSHRDSHIHSSSERQPTMLSLLSMPHAKIQALFDNKTSASCARVTVDTGTGTQPTDAQPLLRHSRPDPLAFLSHTSSTHSLILQRVYSNCPSLSRSLIDCQRLSSVASTSSNFALSLFNLGERF